MKKNIHSYLAFSALALGSLLSSCDSVIFDEQGDCSVHYRVPLTFTQNILDADAFSSQVSSVTLYAFDSEGRLALEKTEKGAPLSSPGYTMEVDLKPGTYSFLVWAEGNPAFKENTSFVIGGGEKPASITDLTASLPLSTASSGAKICENDIVPLFHGYIQNVDLPDTYGEVLLPAVDLVKDTNIFNITIENVNGNELPYDAFTVSIEASNSQLDWNNNLFGDIKFSYLPWCINLLASQRDTKKDTVSGFMAELTTGRLSIERKMILKVHRNSDNTDIVSLDLINLLCMVKGHVGGGLSDQAYLDKVDFFSLMFFVTDDQNWYTANGININGWKVVPPQNEDI